MGVEFNFLVQVNLENGFYNVSLEILVQYISIKYDFCVIVSLQFLMRDKIKCLEVQIYFLNVYIFYKIKLVFLEDELIKSTYKLYE